MWVGCFIYPNLRGSPYWKLSFIFSRSSSSLTKLLIISSSLTCSSFCWAMIYAVLVGLTEWFWRDRLRLSSLLIRYLVEVARDIIKKNVYNISFYSIRIVSLADMRHFLLLFKLFRHTQLFLRQCHHKRWGIQTNFLQYLMSLQALEVLENTRLSFFFGVCRRCHDHRKQELLKVNLAIILCTFALIKNRFKLIIFVLFNVLKCFF